jgi:hypothetical protein
LCVIVKIVPVPVTTTPEVVVLRLNDLFLADTYASVARIPVVGRVKVVAPRVTLLEL